MNRREFSKTVGLGAAGTVAAIRAGDLVAEPLRMAAADTGAAKRVGKAARVDRAHRKEWAKEHFRGFENILMASFTPDLKDLDEAGIRLDVRQSIKNGFFSTLCASPALTLSGAAQPGSPGNCPLPVPA